MKKSAFALIGLISISSLGFLAFKSGDTDKAFYEVEYQVDCKDCTVSYRNQDGASEVMSNVNKWNHKFNAKKGQFVYVSATNSNGDEIKVSILKDGEEAGIDHSARKFVSARVGSIL